MCETFLVINGIDIDPPKSCATVFVLSLTKHERVEEGQEPMELVDDWLAIEWLQDHRI